MFFSILPFQRPLHIKELVQKVTEAFDQRMDMFYLDREVSLPDLVSSLVLTSASLRDTSKSKQTDRRGHADTSIRNMKQTT